MVSLDLCVVSTFGFPGFHGFLGFVWDFTTVLGWGTRRHAICLPAAPSAFQLVRNVSLQSLLARPSACALAGQRQVPAQKKKKAADMKASCNAPSPAGETGRAQAVYKTTCLLVCLLTYCRHVSQAGNAGDTQNMNHLVGK